MPQSLAHVRTWIFDLDNTLYPPEVRLFDQIEVRMTRFVMRSLGLPETEANELRARYWREFGTTLAGMMAHHDTDPTAFLEDVHDISFDALSPDPALADAIDALPGRKLVFTNADQRYAARVLRGLALDGLFSAVYAVEDTGFIPKPERSAYDYVIDHADISPSVSAMFEDDPRNLEVPHSMGMKTVLVGPDIGAAPHLHHQTVDLAGFLSQAMAQRSQEQAVTPGAKA